MRRNRKRISGKLSILFLSIILSLSAMGVGYAAWNQELIISATVTTGDIDVEGRFDKSRLNPDEYEKMEIEVKKIDDYGVTKNVMKINGLVYPEFNNELGIDVIDGGSIPVVLTGVEESEGSDVFELENTRDLFRGLKGFKSSSKKNDGLMSTKVTSEDKVRESFNLKISPDLSKEDESNFSDNYTEKSIRTISFSSNAEESFAVEENSEIERLRNEIEQLNSEIEEYKSINEDYKFLYKVLFEQGY